MESKTFGEIARYDASGRERLGELDQRKRVTACGGEQGGADLSGHGVTTLLGQHLLRGTQVQAAYSSHMCPK